MVIVILLAIIYTVMLIALIMATAIGAMDIAELILNWAMMAMGPSWSIVIICVLFKFRDRSSKTIGEIISAFIGALLLVIISIIPVIPLAKLTIPATLNYIIGLFR